VQKKTFSFTIDCSKPVDDKIMEIGEQQGCAAVCKHRNACTLVQPHAPAPARTDPCLSALARTARTASFQKFLTDKIKVDGRPGMLGESIKVGAEKSKVSVTSDIHLSKRYVYLGGVEARWWGGVSWGVGGVCCQCTHHITSKKGAHTREDNQCSQGCVSPQHDRQGDT